MNTKIKGRVTSQSVPHTPVGLEDTLVLCTAPIKCYIREKKASLSGTPSFLAINYCSHNAHIHNRISSQISGNLVLESRKLTIQLLWLPSKAQFIPA